MTIISTKFEVDLTFRCLIISFLLLICYVTLWLWLLTVWPSSVVTHAGSHMVNPSSSLYCIVYAVRFPFSALAVFLRCQESSLCPPYGIEQAVVFSSCGFFVLSSFFFMAALRSRCGHYIFVLWFLLMAPVSSFFLFSSPNLSGRRLDVYHTSTHDVALVRI